MESVSSVVSSVFYVQKVKAVSGIVKEGSKSVCAEENEAAKR